MGIQPTEFWSMTMWEYSFVQDAYIRSQGGDTGPAELTDEQWIIAESMLADDE